MSSHYNAKKQTEYRLQTLYRSRLLKVWGAATGGRCNPNVPQNDTHQTFHRPFFLICTSSVATQCRGIPPIPGSIQETRWTRAPRWVVWHLGDSCLIQEGLATLSLRGSKIFQSWGEHSFSLIGQPGRQGYGPFLEPITVQCTRPAQSVQILFIWAGFFSYHHIEKTISWC